MKQPSEPTLNTTRHRKPIEDDTHEHPELNGNGKAKKPYRIIVTKDFLFDKTVSHSARFLYLVLRMHWPDPFPSLYTMRDIMGMGTDRLDRERVQKLLDELESAGFIGRTQRRKQRGSRTVFSTNLYELLLEKPNDSQQRHLPTTVGRATVGRATVGQATVNAASTSVPIEKTRPSALPNRKEVPNSSNTASPSAFGGDAGAAVRPSVSAGGKPPAPPSPSAKRKAPSLKLNDSFPDMYTLAYERVFEKRYRQNPHDQEAALHWQNTDVDEKLNYLGIAIQAWEMKNIYHGKVQVNFYSVRHSKNLNGFTRWLSKIEGEVGELTAKDVVERLLWYFTPEEVRALGFNNVDKIAKRIDPEDLWKGQS